LYILSSYFFLDGRFDLTANFLIEVFKSCLAFI